jgi:hypothetical protein
VRSPRFPQPGGRELFTRAGAKAKEMRAEMGGKGKMDFALARVRCTVSFKARWRERTACLITVEEFREENSIPDNL